MSQVATDRQQDDLLWASENYESLLDYMGEYVVIYDRRVVAHGADLEQAIAEASRITGRPDHELTHRAITDPLEDIPH